MAGAQAQPAARTQSNEDFDFTLGCIPGLFPNWVPIGPSANAFHLSKPRFLALHNGHIRVGMCIP